MAAIEEIPGIHGATLDLFRAAGILDSGDLLDLGTEELMDRLEEANVAGRLVARLPAPAAVDAWRGAAKIFEAGSAHGRTRLPAGVMKDVRSPGLPIARQLSSAQLREAGIPASEVPVGKLLAEVSSEMEPDAVASVEVVSNGHAAKKGEVEQGAPVRKDEETTKAPADEAGEDGGRRPDRRQAAIGDLQVREISGGHESRERQQFEALGESRPAQRRLEKRNHGMLHREAGRVYLGALATLAAMALVSIGFVAVGVALVYAFYYEVPLPAVALWFLPAFPLAVVLYVVLGLRPRCRLCGQRLFRPRSCIKHEKAHWSPFGPIFAVALHALARSWFRCMLCGTKQRLRE
jgi:hypothetical protein